MNGTILAQSSIYQLSRRGRKLQVSEDFRTIFALPKEVPERTWSEILQKEENDLLILDIREEIIESALNIGYERYMERQNAPFTVYCAAQAWLQLINWHFYRHDPGEEPTAYPSCYIPKRDKSWIADILPEPSVKDSWAKEDLHVVEDHTEEPLKPCTSQTSLEYPIIEPIPEEYWFPGKVAWPEDKILMQYKRADDSESYETGSSRQAVTVSRDWDYQDASEISLSDGLVAESELLQRVTDYSAEELSQMESSTSALKNTTPVEESLRGGGDSAAPHDKKRYDKYKHSRTNMSQGKSRGFLPPIEKGSHSKGSVISDCRLRSLRTLTTDNNSESSLSLTLLTTVPPAVEQNRLDTQYEVSSEKMDSQGEIFKRK